MNLRIARAFWVYHATRTWPFVLAGLLLGLAVPAFYYLPYRNMATISDVHNVLVAAIYLAVPVQLIGLLYNASFVNSFSCRLPESTLLLPASSFSIAFHRFTFNLMVVGVSVFVLHTFTRVLYDSYLSPWWEWVGGVVGLCALLQFVALATAPTGDWTIGFLIVAAIVYAAPFPRLGLDVSHRVARMILALPFTTIILSFLGMWATVHLVRQGRWSLPTSSAPRATRARGRDRAIKPFKSAWHAQLWLETRTYWRPIFRVFLVFAGLYGLLFFMFGRSEESATSFGPFRIESGAFGLFLMLFSYFLFIAFVAGGIMASLHNRRWQVGPTAAFLYVRPFSIAQFAAARVVAAVRVVIVFVVLPIAWIATSMVMSNDPAVGLNYALFVLPIVACILWAFLWTWNLLALIPIYCVALAFYFLLGMGDPLSERYLEIPFMTLLIGCVCISFWFALRGRLIHPKLLWGLLAATLVVVLPWIYLSLFKGSAGRVTAEPMYNLLIIASVYAFAIAPIATLPLAHRWCRHR